jgi:hypothetical protein
MTKLHFLSEGMLAGVYRVYKEVDRKAEIGDIVHITEDCGEKKSTYGKVVEMRESGSFKYEHLKGDYIEDNYVSSWMGDKYVTLDPTPDTYYEEDTGPAERTCAEDEAASPVETPEGITPRHFLLEARMQEIAGGIARYAAVYEPIPPEWVEEYNELAERKASRKE